MSARDALAMALAIASIVLCAVGAFVSLRLVLAGLAALVLSYAVAAPVRPGAMRRRDQ